MSGSANGGLLAIPSHDLIRANGLRIYRRHLFSFLTFQNSKFGTWEQGGNKILGLWSSFGSWVALEVLNIHYTANRADLGYFCLNSPFYPLSGNPSKVRRHIPRLSLAWVLWATTVWSRVHPMGMGGDYMAKRLNWTTSPGVTISHFCSWQHIMLLNFAYHFRCVKVTSLVQQSIGKWIQRTNSTKRSWFMISAKWVKRACVFIWPLPKPSPSLTPSSQWQRSFQNQGSSMADSDILFNSWLCAQSCKANDWINILLSYNISYKRDGVDGFNQILPFFF